MLHKHMQCLVINAAADYKKKNQSETTLQKIVGWDNLNLQVLYTYLEDLP